jgi:hypothetical protein
MKVNLLINKEALCFKVENSHYGHANAEGIGMNSVKHILNLQYEGKYDMQLLQGENHFSVTLTLNLA